MLNLIYSEQIKLKRTWTSFMSLLIPFAINVLLAIDLQFRYTGYLLKHQMELELSGWQLILMEQRVLYFPALLPFFAALIIAQVFSGEERNSTWQLLLSQPVQRYKIVLSKFLVSCKYILLLVISDVVTLVVVGFITGVAEPFEVNLFLRYFIILTVSTIATAAIQIILFIGFTSIWPGLLSAFVFGMMSQGRFVDNIWGRINIYSYADYAFRSGWEDVIIIVAVSVVAIVIGLVTAVLIFCRNKFVEKG